MRPSGLKGTSDCVRSIGRGLCKFDLRLSPVGCSGSVHTQILAYHIRQKHRTPTRQNLNRPMSTTVPTSSCCQDELATATEISTVANDEVKTTFNQWAADLHHLMSFIRDSRHAAYTLTNVPMTFKQNPATKRAKPAARSESFRRCEGRGSSARSSRSGCSVST